MNNYSKYKKPKAVDVNMFAGENQECELDGVVHFKIEFRETILPWTFIVMRNIGNTCMLGLNSLKYTDTEMNINEKLINFEDLDDVGLNV